MGKKLKAQETGRAAMYDRSKCEIKPETIQHELRFLWEPPRVKNAALCKKHEKSSCSLEDGACCNFPAMISYTYSVHQP